jgi:hypothetical protein
MTDPMVEKVAQVISDHLNANDWRSLVLARAALEACHYAELVEAAQAIISAAERPGSRAEYAISDDGKEIWHDYQEVSQVALDKLATVLAKIGGAQ